VRNGKQDGKGETSVRDDVAEIAKRKNGICWETRG